MAMTTNQLLTAGAIVSMNSNSSDLSKIFIFHKKLEFILFYIQGISISTEDKEKILSSLNELSSKMFSKKSSFLPKSFISFQIHKAENLMNNIVEILNSTPTCTTGSSFDYHYRKCFEKFDPDHMAYFQKNLSQVFEQKIMPLDEAEKLLKFNELFVHLFKKFINKFTVCQEDYNFILGQVSAFCDLEKYIHFSLVFHKSNPQGKVLIDKYHTVIKDFNQGMLDFFKLNCDHLVTSGSSPFEKIFNTLATNDTKEKINEEFKKYDSLKKSCCRVS